MNVTKYNNAEKYILNWYSDGHFIKSWSVIKIQGVTEHSYFRFTMLNPRNVDDDEGYKRETIIDTSFSVDIAELIVLTPQ